MSGSARDPLRRRGPPACGSKRTMMSGEIGRARGAVEAVPRPSATTSAATSIAAARRDPERRSAPPRRRRTRNAVAGLRERGLMRSRSSSGRTGGGREPPVGRCSTRSAIAAASGSCVTITTARSRQAAEQRQHGRAVLAVEVAGRLVGQHQLGIVDERAGDREPLLLAAGQLVRPAIGDLGEPELARSAAALAARRRAARPAAAPAAARSPRRSAPRSGETTGTRSPTCRSRARASARGRRPRQLLAGERDLAPRRGGRAPPSRCRSVDFPLPDGPSTATTSPASTSRLDAVEHAPRRATRPHRLRHAASFQDRHCAYGSARLFRAGPAARLAAQAWIDLQAISRESSSAAARCAWIAR